MLGGDIELAGICYLTSGMTTLRYCRCDHDGRNAVWTIIKDVINMSLMHTPEGLQKLNNMTCTYRARNKSLRKVSKHILNGLGANTNYSQSLGCRGVMKDMPLTTVAPRKGWESHSVGKFMFEIDGTATWRDCWCQLPVTIWFLNRSKGGIQGGSDGDNNPSCCRSLRRAIAALVDMKSMGYCFVCSKKSGRQRWCSLKSYTKAFRVTGIHCPHWPPTAWVWRRFTPEELIGPIAMAIETSRLEGEVGPY